MVKNEKSDLSVDSCRVVLRRYARDVLRVAWHFDRLHGPCLARHHWTSRWRFGRDLVGAPALLWFLLPFLMSGVLFAAAQLFKGQVSGYPLLALLGAFLLLHLGIAGYLIVHLKGSRIAAASLSVFTVSYALAVLIPAAFVFSDSYL